MTPHSLTDLISRVEAREISNELDVLIEVALFTPDSALSGLRANAAGTKVIGTHADGSECTCWAAEWSLNRSTTLAALKARARTPDEKDQTNVA